MKENKRKIKNPLTVHWDGKIMPDLQIDDKVDRLPILVTNKSANNFYMFQNYLMAQGTKWQKLRLKR